VSQDFPSGEDWPKLVLVRIGNQTIDYPDDWRLELTAATQRLLGDTIGLDDADWQTLSALPGWSRAHVATHLTHHGRAVAAMTRQIAHSHASVLWRTVQTDTDLNAGARRHSLEIQEGLDQSSAALVQAFDSMEESDWEVPVVTSQGSLPASILVLDRLNQLLIHHVDLQLGFDLTDIAPGLTRTLVQWNLFRTTPRFCRVELTIISDEGFQACVGEGRVVTVRGNETNILGWLTGRKDSSAVLGAEELDLAGPL